MDNIQLEWELDWPKNSLASHVDWSHMHCYSWEKKTAKYSFWFHSVQVKTITLSMLKTGTDHLNGDEEGGGGGENMFVWYIFIVDSCICLS